MPLKDQVKNFARKLTEPRPDDGELQKILRKPNSRALMFTDDGTVPNHPRWPTIIHRRAVKLPSSKDAAALIDRILRATGGGVRGAIASMISSITTRKLMRYLGLLAGKPSLNSAG